jgi:hypothetical protein
MATLAMAAASASPRVPRDERRRRRSIFEEDARSRGGIRPGAGPQGRHASARASSSSASSSSERWVKRSVSRTSYRSNVEREARVKSDDGKSPQGTACTTRTGSYGEQSHLDNALARAAKRALGFFRARVDLAMEDDEEASVSAVVAPSADGASAARWAVDVDLFLRSPMNDGPLTSAKAAAALERVSLSLDVDFAPRDAGMFPSRGAAGVRGSRFFAGSRGVDPRAASSTFDGFCWIADEPGYFKFTLPASAPVTASGVDILPAGPVYFNAKIVTTEDGAEEKTAVRLTSGVVTVKRDLEASFLGANYRGILAEYVVVGTFTGTRRN